MMDKRYENKIISWEKERRPGAWIYSLINSALTTLTLYIILGTLSWGKIISIPFLTFTTLKPYILPAFAILYIIFLFQFKCSEKEYKELLKHKEE